MSEHFSIEEFTRSDTAEACGIDNTPSPVVELELLRLMGVMEKVRTLLDDQPVTITSGYRCPELNEEIGGAADSDHLYGRACDFVAAGYLPLEICHRLELHLEELGVDQLIHEFNDWVHLAIAAPGTEPKCECLTIDQSGTAVGFA